jgi:hypothetical protein
VGAVLRLGRAELRPADAVRHPGLRRLPNRSQGRLNLPHQCRRTPRTSTDKVGTVDTAEKEEREETAGTVETAEAAFAALVIPRVVTTRVVNRFRAARVSITFPRADKRLYWPDRIGLMPSRNDRTDSSAERAIRDSVERLREEFEDLARERDSGSGPLCDGIAQLRQEVERLRQTFEWAARNSNGGQPEVASSGVEAAAPPYPPYPPYPPVAPFPPFPPYPPYPSNCGCCPPSPCGCGKSGTAPQPKPEPPSQPQPEPSRSSSSSPARSSSSLSSGRRPPVNFPRFSSSSSTFRPDHIG